MRSILLALTALMTAGPLAAQARHVVQVAQLLRKRGTAPGFDHGDEYAV